MTIANRPKPFTIVQGICDTCGDVYAHVTSGDVCHCYEDELEQEIEKLQKRIKELEPEPEIEVHKCPVAGGTYQSDHFDHFRQQLKCT